MAKHPTEYGQSPTGRIISGDPWTKQTTDANGRPIPDEKQNYWFALAVEKTAPGVQEMLGTMWKAAAAGYANSPNVMAQVNQGISAPQFSWKVDDGDEMKTDPTTGQQVLRWKHGAGCYVFKFSTTLPINSAKWQNGVPVFANPSEIKRGYYVQVAYSTTANGNQDHTAGVYLNPQTVCLVAFGEEIVGGPSLAQQFAGGPGSYMPAGATAAPVGPSAAPVSSGMPGPTPQPAPAMGQPPQPAGMPTPASNGYGGATNGQQPAPYGGYMQPNGGGMPGLTPQPAPYEDDEIPF